MEHVCVAQQKHVHAVKVMVCVPVTCQFCTFHSLETIVTVSRCDTNNVENHDS